MKIKLRLIISIFLAISVSFYFLVNSIVKEIRYRYMEAIEESLNDTAHILASQLESEIWNNSLRVSSLKSTFNRALRRRFTAEIFEYKKTNVNLQVYVADRRGIIIYDSNDGKDEGKNFLEWRDIYRTLQGEYGARSSNISPTEKAIYVGAPVKSRGRIIGVLTVVKPKESVSVFIDHAKQKVILAGALAFLVLLLLNVLITIWITRPISKLINYVKNIKNNPKVKIPRVGRTEIGDLAEVFDEMREELEGKKYIEQFIQVLTHEIKSPLSSIQGAAELLEDDMPGDMRARFINNIQTESKRIERITQRLLQLSSLENRRELNKVENIELRKLMEDIINGLDPVLKKKELKIINRVDPSITVSGEKFLIEQAVINLIQNALDFTPPGGRISIDSKIACEKDRHTVSVKISDTGSGIPEYAYKKIYDRFYSLPRPGTNKKSSGLGLTFVREVAALHGGDINVINNEGTGVTSTLTLKAF